jgi:hypothetical protein
MANKERVQLLVDVLRSGEYQQGRERLTRVDENGKEFDCCLGVACKVYIKHANPNYETMIEDGQKAYGPNEEAGLLPDEVREWFDFRDNNPMLNLNDGDHQATVANDVLKLSFSEIAAAFAATYITNQGD